MPPKSKLPLAPDHPYIKVLLPNLMIRDKLDWHIVSCVVSRIDYSRGDFTVVVTPPSMYARWYRWWDDMDAIEAQASHGTNDYVLESLYLPPFYKVLHVPTGQIKHATFEMVNDKECQPVAPNEVLLLCEFLSLFKDRETAKRLRPMMYTFWE